MGQGEVGSEPVFGPGVDSAPGVHARFPEPTAVRNRRCEARSRPDEHLAMDRRCRNLEFRPEQEAFRGDDLAWNPCSSAISEVLRRVPRYRHGSWLTYATGDDGLKFDVPGCINLRASSHVRSAPERSCASASANFAFVNVTTNSTNPSLDRRWSSPGWELAHSMTPRKQVRRRV